MKQKDWKIRLSAALAGLAAAVWPAAGQIMTPTNYDQVATLKWYVNQVATYPVGHNPSALIFDGENIWVANKNDATVTKLRASDGSNLGTFPLGWAGPSPAQPDALGFDGANIWVDIGNVDIGNNEVAKLRSGDGKILGAFPGTLTSMAFDGSSMWGSSPAGVVALRAGDAKQLVNHPFCPNNPIAFDGAHIICVDHNSLVALDPRVGRISYQQPIPSGQYAPLASDGGVNWVARWDIYPFNAGNGSPLQDGGYSGQNPISASDQATFLVLDGTNIWGAGRLLAKYSLWPSPGGGPQFTFAQSNATYTISCPSAMAFDGVHIWVTDNCANAVRKF